MWHPYGTVAVVYPDGRTVYRDQKRWDKFDQQWRAAQPLYEKYVDALSSGKIDKETMKQIQQAESIALNETLIRVRDIQSVIDRLEEMNAGKHGSMFENRIDTRNIGVLGVSFGGGSAVAACFSERRIKACVSLDGFLRTVRFDDPIVQPVMFFYHDVQHKELESYNKFIYDQIENTMAEVRINRSIHDSFTNDYLVSPIYSMLKYRGKAKPERVMYIVNKYMLAFFDGHLKGYDDGTLLRIAKEFPEVEFNIIDRSASVSPDE